MHSTKIITSIVVLLTIIVAFSLFGSYSLNSTSKELESHIIKVEESSKLNNWNESEEELKIIRDIWQKSEYKWSLLLDHSEIDNIDNSLSRLIEYVNSQEKALSSGELANLKQYVTHIPKKESFSFNNIF